jgi:hypothetical protein
MTCTVDATRPSGTLDLVEDLDGYIRENRESINYLCGLIGTGVLSPDYSAINMTVGDTSLAVGVDLSESGIEVIGLTADAAVNLTTITDGTAGQIKVFVALDGDVTFIQDTSMVGGTFYMNAPDDEDINVTAGDIIAFVNIGGDGESTDGYWLELWRKLQV